MSSLDPFQTLIRALRVLPGVGPKAALRMAHHLIERDRVGAQALMTSLDEALTLINRCQRCHTLSMQSICAICQSSERDQSLLCVVESPVDMNSIEQTNRYRGYYYVLAGRISPLDGVGPNEVGVNELLKRARAPEIKEVILATSFTHEGQATAHFIAEKLAHSPLKVTRLARGMPVGGEIEYVDGLTLAEALGDRRDYSGA